MVWSVPSRWRKLVAALVGAALAGGSAVFLNFGVRHYIQHEGLEGLRLSASRTVARADWRLDQTLVGLSELASIAIDSCADVDVAELRRAVMTITPVKELSVVGPDGSLRCQHLGLGGESWSLSRELPAQGDPGVLISVVRLPERNQRALRIRWNTARSPLSVAALIPADMFLSSTDLSAVSDNIGIRMSMSEGSLIIGNSTAGDGKVDQDHLYASATSSRYPLEVVASISYADLWSSHKDLVSLGAAGSVCFTVIIGAFIVLAPWRSRKDPIADIERGLRAGEFVPYLQPVFDLTTGRLAGAEVLARWRKSDGSLVSPVTFIPLIESYGLIRQLTCALMRGVRDQAGDVIGCRPGLRVGFNLGAEQLADDEIVEDVRSIFSDSPIRLSQITLEVTERQPLENLDSARQVISNLQKLGCRVALDDVGTGHAGLSYILKLGVDTIKIDKMFVDAIGNERYSTTIIDMLVDLARTMQLSIVAEGVETFEQVKVLRDRGVRFAQGYIFTPPLPMKAFVSLLEAADPLPALDVSEGGASESVDEAPDILMPRAKSA